MNGISMTVVTGSNMHELDCHIEDAMREAILPPALFSKGQITDGRGEPFYDLDDWPRELINCSEAFLQRTGGEPFHGPEDESHGENDAVTGRYCIDFKFILGNSVQHAIRETSVEKVVVAPGCTLSCASRTQRTMYAVRVHAALRGCSFGQLRDLARKDPRRQCSDMVERDLAYLARSIDKEKNLLLILPLLFYTDNGADLLASDMNRVLCDDFKHVFALRRELHPEMETFLSYFHEGEFFIAQVFDSGLAEFDVVAACKSKTLMDILSNYDMVDYPLIDRLLGN